MDHRKTSPDSPAAPASATPPPATLPPSTLPEPEFGFAPPDHYDPEEYRWVPVRRQPRRDGWTEEKQRRFIEVLADTGLVGMAAREVGMTRTAAYKLRRAPHAAAFARAWDLARERAGALIEDIAFERAIEGVETEVYDRFGGLTGSKTVYNDRLLTFLLRHLKPERYGSVTQMRGAAGQWPAGSGAAECRADGELPAPPLPAPDTMDAALRAMEPALPAPVETMFDPDDLDAELLTADIMDGKLPHHLAEQSPVKTDEQLRKEALRAQYERGREIYDTTDAATHATLSHEDESALYLYMDPSQASQQPRKRRRKKSDQV